MATIANRGPDGRGVHVAMQGRVGFVHTRLAIIDPLARSGQPLIDPRTSAFITFNGEIYNYRKLRADLAARGVQFLTESDTEVLLNGYLADGSEFFRRLRGMYSFAIFDPRTDQVLAVRDPLGLKPLYLEVGNRRVGFGSSPMAASATGDRPLDPAAAVSVAVLGAVLEPLSPYLGVTQVPPGTCCRIALRSDALRISYSSVEPQFPWLGGSRQGLGLLGDELANSVDAHFTADVPVAVFQSAGLDSTTISTLARQLGRRPTLLTIGFDAFRGSITDEVPGAVEIAARLELPHRFVYLTEDELMAVRGRFLADMQTPTADAFNTYLAARFCRSEGFKVALSGVGGDELFAGYSAFQQLPKLNGLGAVAATGPGRMAAKVGFWAASALARRRSPKLKHGADYLADWSRRYLLRRAYFLPEELPGVLDAEIVEAGLPRFWEAYDALSHRTLTQDAAGVRALETDIYMRNVLLRDADWAGMAHGVEIRAPFVDVPLYRALCDDADRCAYRKEDLRLLANSVSPTLQLAPRPKTGFTVPRRSPGSRDPKSGATELAFLAKGHRAWNRQVLRHWFGDWVTDEA